MKTINCYLILTSLFLGSSMGVAQESYSLKNQFMERVLHVSSDGQLSTELLENKRASTHLQPEACAEFQLRISDGTDKENTDRMLTNRDFRVVDVTDYTNPEHKKSKGYQFTLQNEEVWLKIRYELEADEPFCRKSMEIVPLRDLTLERVDVEAIRLEDAHQNYTIREMFAQGSHHWKPGLGQPLYTLRSASFWGMEFPAATNRVEQQWIYCGYSPGIKLKAGQKYVTYYSVIGMADNAEWIDEAFYEYIDKIRIRPARLQIQYNSWFDFSKSVSSDKFIGSVKTIHRELVEKRTCPPLNAYVIDDGWQDAGEHADWSDTLWTVNDKFQADFKDCFEAVRKRGSQLGLWLSPASILGALPMVPKMEKYGFESLGMGMSMTGPIYMRKLEKRIMELAHMGVAYFKFDGLFGHLNTRDFEVKGRGTAAMPQLEVAGLKGNEEILNDSRYDELKEYYLCAGTENLMRIFKQLGTLNPNIFIAITNGAYLSPWWLQYVDVVWLINAGDAARGSSRTEELVYRDAIYHQIWQEEHTKFPMNSIFNHEPKKTSSEESLQAFKDYLFMNLSRGTGFIELYIKTKALSSSDWDVMADGLKWAHEYFPVFKHVRMHGGNPKLREVYGYTAWNCRQGYISFHNPSDKPQEYVFNLSRKNGVPEKLSKHLHCTSPSNRNLSQLPDRIAYGDNIRVVLQPHEILLLNFK